jgi:hypothetical protein
MSVTTSLTLIIDNDGGMYEQVMAKARAIAETAGRGGFVEQKDGVWDGEHAAKYHMADWLKAWAERAVEGLQGKHGLGNWRYNVLFTLAQSAMERVDWDEMAVHYLGKVGEGS